MFGGAAFAGYMGILFLSIALWWALGNAIGHGWSALVVAVLWLVVAGGAGAARPQGDRRHPRPAAHHRDGAEDSQRGQGQRGAEPMSNDPEEIRRQIEATRAGLSDDVNALSDKVSPTQIAKRQRDKLMGTAQSVKDSIMGSADDAKSSAGQAMSAVGDAVSGAPGAVAEQHQGQPARGRV